MIFKFIIPKVYFFHCNLYLESLINNFKNKKPITKEVEDIGRTLNSIITVNKGTWTGYNAVELDKDYLEFLCLQYVRRYQDTRLIDWHDTSGAYPKPTSYDFLIYLIFMMGNPAETMLANVEYDDDILTLELEYKELNYNGNI